ncbi:hypothetical protein [Hymenobacter jejuensis]|uniref:Uncharacterized protein n=1 Tax=Hymenobacter jejuensis TaxID=2502781 RepID=A0A5B8A3B1_9BACT|nr:hypothetical protein [Hymenobacter jejuensis]QDA61924.1 hypothetical protein FHG12_18280 [Hymenobacter jejuensis]
MNKWLGVLVVLMGLVSRLSSGQTRELSQQQAIHLAEMFIQENGYTSAPANRANLTYELFDADEKDINTLLQARRNRLHPKAFCISDDPDNWHVGFLSTSVDLSKLTPTQQQADLSGRAVIVNKRNKEVKLAHKDPRFSLYKKL